VAKLAGKRRVNRILRLCKTRCSLPLASPNLSLAGGFAEQAHIARLFDFSSIHLGRKLCLVESEMDDGFNDIKIIVSCDFLAKDR